MQGFADNLCSSIQSY